MNASYNTPIDKFRKWAKECVVVIDTVEKLGGPIARFVEVDRFACIRHPSRLVEAICRRIRCATKTRDLFTFNQSRISVLQGRIGNGLGR